MDLMIYIRKIQKALKYNHNIKTTITSYEYFNDEKNRYSHTYSLRVNGKERKKTGSKYLIMQEMLEILKEAEQDAK